jgi:hypothetical protein
MTNTECKHYDLCREHPERREAKRNWKEQDYRNHFAHELLKLRKTWGDEWKKLAETLLATEKHLESLEHSWKQKVWLELAKKLIEEWHWRVVLHHLNIFEWLDYNVAEILIEQKKWYEVCRNIKNFQESYHKEIAEKLLEIWWHSELAWLVRNLQYFVWLDDDFSTRLLKKMVNSLFIWSDDEYIMKENKWKFKKWDVENMKIWAQNRDMETATTLIDEWKKYLNKEYWKLREECVKKNINRYTLACTKFALKLIIMLNNWDSMDDVWKTVYNRWDSYNAFFSLIYPTVIRFSKRGEEFGKYMKDKFK